MEIEQTRYNMKILLIATLLFLVVVDSAKILFFPSTVNSHIIFFSKFAKGLADQGHEIEFLVASNIRVSIGQYNSNVSSGSLKYIVYEAGVKEAYANSEDMSKALVDVAMTDSPWSKFWKNFELEGRTMQDFENDCLDLMRNKEIRKQLSMAGFQFAITDIIVPHCRNLLPIALNIPYATYSIPWFSWIYRVPRLMSFTSFMGDLCTNEMSFYERLSTFVREMLYMILYYFATDYSTEFLPLGSEPVSAIKSFERASLWFFLEDVAVGYPNANMPNTISMGDIMIDNDVKPLQGELEKFILDQSSHRKIVLMSLGSFFDHVPESVIERFCQAFRKVSGKLAFIWKLNKRLNDACPGADNIYVDSWLPQNDLLAHGSILFFITHGGLNSIIESVNHKKPMIVFPLAIDQPGNAAMAESKGYAISLSLKTFSVDDLVNSMHSLLNDPSYKEKAILYSGILNDKPAPPAERASRLINHVLKFGDVHLRTSAFKLDLFQFFMFDVFLFLTFVVLFIFIFFILIIRFVYKFIKNLLYKKSKKDININKKKLK